MFGNCLKYVVLFLVSDLPVLLHHVWLLIAVLDVLIYLVLPHGFTDILNFCIAYGYAFCPSILEHKIQRECFSGRPCLRHYDNNNCQDTMFHLLTFCMQQVTVKVSLYSQKPNIFDPLYWVLETFIWIKNICQKSNQTFIEYQFSKKRDKYETRQSILGFVCLRIWEE